MIYQNERPVPDSGARRIRQLSRLDSDGLIGRRVRHPLELAIMQRPQQQL
jgi:hypothetical protein